MASNQWHVRCTNGFFVGGRGIVNPNETVLLNQGEAKDVIAANRGERITQKEYEEGPQADFKPKDENGKVIPADTRTRAQLRVAARAQAARVQEQARAATRGGTQSVAA
jgi:hypothetical protein